MLFTLFYLLAFSNHCWYLLVILLVGKTDKLYNLLNTFCSWRHEILEFTRLSSYWFLPAEKSKGDETWVNFWDEVIASSYGMRLWKKKGTKSFFEVRPVHDYSTTSATLQNFQSVVSYSWPGELSHLRYFMSVFFKSKIVFFLLLFVVFDFDLFVLRNFLLCSSLVSARCMSIHPSLQHFVPEHHLLTTNHQTSLKFAEDIHIFDNVLVDPFTFLLPILLSFHWPEKKKNGKVLSDSHSGVWIRVAADQLQFDMEWIPPMTDNSKQ